MIESTEEKVLNRLQFIVLKLSLYKDKILPKEVVEEINNQVTKIKNLLTE